MLDHTKEYYWDFKFSDLVGEEITAIRRGEYDNNDAIIFEVGGHTYALGHSQDCCESVWIEDINGDLEDLVGVITQAEESSEAGPVGEYDDSSTWTFYLMATNKGSVNIRFCGSSNGYYSESANFYKVS